MLSGTPVISSDFGAFAEYNLHGRTGYRCRTFEQFEWAARHIGNIKPAACRKWAQNFSLDKIGARYEDYFESVAAIKDGGWYAKNMMRTSLDNATNLS
jgi:glycosyltransferase involved in cell wall biosynthesis